MKKIIFITSEFPPLPGGIGNHAYFLSAYLEKEGYEVTVITNFREVYKDKAFDQDQVFKVVRVKRNAFTYFNRFKVSFSYVGKNEFIIVSGKFSLWIGASLKLFFKSKTKLADIQRIREELIKCFKADTMTSLQMLFVLEEIHPGIVKDVLFQDGMWLKPTFEK